jgi:S-(hydroxymethyl)glutathione dehydrogenase/alcohol dehydrogenase
MSRSMVAEPRDLPSAISSGGNQTMKAAVLRAFEMPLVIEDVTLAPPEAGEVTVAVAACAICHSDIHYADGAWGGTPPLILGHEASGIVEAVGPGVRDVAPGDRVIVSLIRHCGHCFHCERGEPTQCETRFPLDTPGRLKDSSGVPIGQGIRTAAFAERTVVHESQCVLMPADLGFEQAALLACGVITGLGAVTNTAKVPVGSSVVVVGTGGVGLNAVQGARLSGAHPIIAIDLSDEKLEAARRFGATHAINPANSDVTDQVRALTGGRGADAVLVTVGSTPAMVQAMALPRRGGTVVLVGMPATGAKLPLEVGDIADYAQTVIGSKMGAARPKTDIPKLIELYKDGRLLLDELITSRYPLERINEAFASVKRGEALRNVIVF